MTPQDAHLLAAVYDVNQTLNTHRCANIPDEGGICSVCGATWSQIFDAPIRVKQRSTYLGTITSADSNPDALRFNALRAMGRE